MGKRLFIAEKPSVAQEFAKALRLDGTRRDGYLEASDTVITWCVGHLVTMSYPEVYDPALKKWSLQALPFLPKQYHYEVIPQVKKQFEIVAGLLNREDVTQIYVCTDSGREGEYIYRLVDQMAGVSLEKEKRRVWIDSQTEEEILRGIREAKPLSAYDALSCAAYLRAKEDYLMGINFSRVLSLKYGSLVMRYVKSDKWKAISVGRVMTCVLGMVVRREWEIRNFVKTSFYRVLVQTALADGNGCALEGEWRAAEGSWFYQSPLLYKENGFLQKETAKKLICYLADESLGEDYAKEMIKAEKKTHAAAEHMASLKAISPSDGKTQEHKTVVYAQGTYQAVVEKIEKKKELKYPPLLYNLAELQNDCSRFFKISPDETLAIVQELYEKKLVTYPRTDARVLSSAVAKEIDKQLSGLCRLEFAGEFAEEILSKGSWKNIAKSRYVNDSKITDHYAVIPTGQIRAAASLQGTKRKVYEVIVRRFLAIFFPAAVYQKIAMTVKRREERFFYHEKVLAESGYLKVMEHSFFTKQTSGEEHAVPAQRQDGALFDLVKHLKKGSVLFMKSFSIKEGETSPPKRYNSGSMILAMENAGQLIEDEELRAQIKGSGIGTSATRAEILHKLVNIQYLKLNQKTQVITPELFGELVYLVVAASMKNMLNPEMTASWEKGLSMVAKGEITQQQYMEKLETYVGRMTEAVKRMDGQWNLLEQFDKAAAYYDTKSVS